MGVEFNAAKTRRLRRETLALIRAERKIGEAETILGFFDVAHQDVTLNDVHDVLHYLKGRGYITYKLKRDRIGLGAPLPKINCIQITPDGMQVADGMKEDEGIDPA